MIEETIKLLKRTFSVQYEEIKLIRSNIKILNSTSKPFNEGNHQNSNEYISSYGLFISYYSSLNHEADMKELIEKTKNEEDFVNKFKEKDYIKIIKAIKTGRMSNVYLNDKLLRMYNFLNDHLSNEEITNMIKILIGNKIAGRKKQNNEEIKKDYRMLSEINPILGLKKLDFNDEEWEYIYFLDEGLEKLKNYLNHLIEKQESLSSRGRKVAIVYDETEDLLKENADIPIMSIKEQGKSCYTDEILNNLYQIILHNQAAKSSELDLSLMKLGNKSDKEQLNQIFHKYHLTLDMFMNKDFIIRHCNASDISLMMQELKLNGFDVDNSANLGLDYVLIGSDPAIVSDIMHYISASVVSLDFALKNLGIFISEEKYDYFANEGLQIPVPLYEKLIYNINIFKNQKINFKSASYNPQMLMAETEVVDKSSKLMRDYELSNFELLSNCAIFDLIDLLIEKGYDEKTFDFENIKEYDIELIRKRIMVQGMLDQNIELNGKLIKEVVTGQRFIVDDELLTDYIINESDDFISKEVLLTLSTDSRLVIDEELIQSDELDKLDHNNLVEGNYVFDGIVISKNKVRRNLTTIMLNNPNLEIKEAMFYAIIYKSYLSSYEIDVIKSHLFPKTYQIEQE